MFCAPAQAGFLQHLKEIRYLILHGLCHEIKHYVLQTPCTVAAPIDVNRASSLSWSFSTHPSIQNHPASVRTQVSILQPPPT